MRLKVLPILISLIFSSVVFAETKEIRDIDAKAAAAAAAEEATKAKFAKNTGNWSVEAHNATVKRLAKRNQDEEAAVAELENKIKKFKSEVELREKGEGKFWYATKSNLENVEALRLAQIKVNEATKAQISQHEKAVTNISNLNPKSLEIGLAKLEARHLFLENSQVNGLLVTAGMKINELYAQIDNQLLGQYSRYVADQAIKKFADKGLCEAVNKCSNVKATATAVKKIEAEIKPFKQWMKDAEAEARKASPPAAQDTGYGAT